ncbi:helix-turn-helix domain-containing protein [Paenibacillus sp. NPDC057967]|uniref:helix-turn-helix domain-containing protein n=1 Tax=Paenibacillus sp. NPDC057967 TaxID=3346293 RepID=UPI0036D88F52
MAKKAVIITNIDKILFEKEMSQGKLAELTGLRPNTISEIVRDSRTVINKVHLARIADALDVDNIGQLLEIAYVEEEGGLVHNREGYIVLKPNAGTIERRAKRREDQQ